MSDKRTGNVYQKCNLLSPLIVENIVSVKVIEGVIYFYNSKHELVLLLDKDIFAYMTVTEEKM